MGRSFGVDDRGWHSNLKENVNMTRRLGPESYGRGRATAEASLGGVLALRLKAAFGGPASLLPVLDSDSVVKVTA